MRTEILLSVVICATAAAQDRPQTMCAFDGFEGTPKLEETTKSTVAYFGCRTAKDCVPGKLAEGDVVNVYRAEGDWTCAYLTQRDGAGPGWVRTRDIREVPADPAPPLDAWFGTWANGRGRIRIAATKNARKLQLEGQAEWHGIGDVVHTGEFSGEAAPEGNRLHFVENGAGSCTVDLTLIGKYLLANDNNLCGGMNVRFWGVWKRSKR
jgi:hypothetical protein